MKIIRLHPIRHLPSTLLPDLWKETPTMLGQFVVGVAVKEYRSGVLIGTHYRDFQFNVTDCEPTAVAKCTKML
jgi:hypothetical protein